MKNILKFALLTLIGASAFSITSYADVDPSEVIKLKKDLISVNPEEGQYKIRLETYVTGSSVTHTELVAVPIDLVLVLDVSSSMINNNVPGEYKARTSSDYTYNNYGTNKYYYSDADGYYLVERGYTGNSQNRKYNLHFTKNGTTYYLTDSGVTTTVPTNVTSGGTKIWTGVLYTSTQITRLQALKNACNAFIDEVAKNTKGEDGELGTDDDIQNRISIVSFSRHEKYITGGTSGNTFHDRIADDRDTDYGNNFISIYGSVAETNILTLKNYINNLSTNSGTRQDRGLLAATNNLNAIPADRFAVSQKVVVVFTDGEPYPSQENLQDGVTTRQQTRNKACAYSYVLKSGSNDAGVPYKAKVFTVSTGLKSGSVNDLFMQFVSSNYPTVTGTTGDDNTCNPVPSTAQPVTGANFAYNTESGADLSSIFTAIAKSSTEGGETYPLDKESTTIIDVVSNNFMIPEGTKAEDVKIWVETYWKDASDVPQWAQKGDPHYHYSDGTIPVPVIDGNTLSVNGFDFAKQDTKDANGDPVFGTGNWVGPREFDNEDGTKTVKYWGNKLVIEFPINLNPDYEGGYSMPSNDIESGLYVKGEKILGYPVPTVDFPSICIMKEGLKVGESALFEVTGPKDVKYTVRLTQNGTDPCYVILKRLTGGEYTVKENSWSWMYSPKAGTPTEIKQTVVPADQLGIKVEDFLNDGSSATELYLDGYKVGMKMDYQAPVAGTTSGTYCVLLNKDGLYTLDDLKGCAISLLYYFSDIRVTTDKAAHSEAYSHNKFKGGHTGGGTEEGGDEEEDI